MRILDTVLLPVAIEPVKPMRSMVVVDGGLVLGVVGIDGILGAQMCRSNLILRSQ